MKGSPAASLAQAERMEFVPPVEPLFRVAALGAIVEAGVQCVEAVENAHEIFGALVTRHRETKWQVAGKIRIVAAGNEWNADRAIFAGFQDRSPRQANAMKPQGADGEVRRFI